MPSVVAFDDIKPERIKYRCSPGKPGAISTPFFRATINTPDSPTAFVNRYEPGRGARAHFHIVDQFQIIVDGKGTFGRHEVTPYCVHFSRAYTPYGPLQSDKETGWAFLALRTHYDPGSQAFPESLPKLRETPNRRPWQITRPATFPAMGSGVALQDIADITDEHGLFAQTLKMAPNTEVAAPSPAGGDGQFVVALRGNLIYDNREHQALTVAHIKPDEEAFRIRAGAQGLEGLILNLPRIMPRAPTIARPSNTPGFKKWQCALCSFAYDEARGIPSEGIPAGTRWEEVPETWSCPDCSASKSDFQMVEIPNAL